jgi:hypothetical protein
MLGKVILVSAVIVDPVAAATSLAWNGSILLVDAEDGEGDGTGVPAGGVTEFFSQPDYGNGRSGTKINLWVIAKEAA